MSLVGTLSVTVDHAAITLEIVGGLMRQTVYCDVVPGKSSYRARRALFGVVGQQRFCPILSGGVGHNGTIGLT